MDYLHLKKVYKYTLVSKKTIMDIVAVSFVGILVYFDLLQVYEAAPFLIFFRGTGCVDGDSGDDGGCGFCDGGDDTTVISTPYLYIKKRGHYEMQNDVMIGTPSSYVQSKEEGELRMQSGMVGSDLYPFTLDGANIGM